MDQSYFASFNGMFSFDIYEVDDYVDPSLLDQYDYYETTQSPSFSGGYVYDNQGYTYDYGAYHFEYHPVYYYEYPTYVGYYPLTNLQYSPEYFYHDNYVYVPVNIYYYVPNVTYYTTEATYNVSDIAYHLDPAHAYESEMMSSTLEQSFDTFEQFNGNICNIGNSSTEIVGEEQTTFQIYYVEPEEVLNDAPPVDDENESGLENESESSAGDEVNDVQLADPGPSSSVDRDAVEENNNENALEPLSASEMRAFKTEMSKAYTHLKKNLFNDVDSGYSNMRYFLKNIKWKYDRFKHQQAIRLEQEKAKKSYDMESYYFHDDLSIIRSRFMYEDDVETYVLYELLRSINIPDLKEWMEKNYKKNKQILYKKECKGHQEMEKKLQKLQWEPTKLVPIPEDEPLKITDFEYMENFVKDLENISRQKYIQKKKKKKRKKKKADVIETDSKSPITVENPQQSSSSLESIDLSIHEKSEIPLFKEEVDIESAITEEDLKPQPDYHENIDLPIHEKPEIPLCKEEVDIESPITEEDLKPQSDSHENIDLPIHEKSEILLCKEEVDIESPITEEDLKPQTDSHENIDLLIHEKSEIPLCEGEVDIECPITEEDLKPQTDSHENIDLPIHEESEILLCKEEVDIESPITEEDLKPQPDSHENIDLPIHVKPEIPLCKEELNSESSITVEGQDRSSAFHESKELPIPEKSEMPLRKEESHSITDDLLPSVENTDKFQDIPEVSVNEEERNRIAEKIVEDSPFAMLSGDKQKEIECLSNLDVTVIAAAAQKDDPKKRFSCIRKFLARMCCCTKTPPS